MSGTSPALGESGYHKVATKAISRLLPRVAADAGQWCRRKQLKKFNTELLHAAEGWATFYLTKTEYANSNSNSSAAKICITNVFQGWPFPN